MCKGVLEYVEVRCGVHVCVRVLWCECVCKGCCGVHVCVRGLWCACVCKGCCGVCVCVRVFLEGSEDRSRLKASGEAHSRLPKS